VGLSSETLSEKKDRLGDNILRNTENAKEAEAETPVKIAVSVPCGLGEVQTEASR